MDKLALVSHCYINQNSVLKPLRRPMNTFVDVVKTLLDDEIGIIQLPCPELLYAGLDRADATYEVYDNDKYRKLVQEKLSEMFSELETYKPGLTEIQVHGVLGSPSCGVFHTVKGPIDNCGLVDGSGVFMEELKLLLDEFSNKEIEIYWNEK